MGSSGISVGYFVFAIVLVGILYSFIKFGDVTKKFFKKPIGRALIIAFIFYFFLTFLLNSPYAFFAPLEYFGTDDTIVIISASACAGIVYFAIMRLVREIKDKGFNLEKMFDMFTNPGEKIKKVSIVAFWLSVLAYIVLAFTIGADAGVGTFILLLIVCPICAYLSTLFLVAFGELVVNSNKIESEKNSEPVFKAEEESAK